MKKLVTIISILLLCFKAEAQSSALAIADSLYTTGSYTNAINYYAKVGSLKSKLQIARTYNKIGNYDKAILQYENVIAKDTAIQIASFELGKLYLKTKRFEKGALLFSSLTQKNKNNPEYYYYQGESLQDLGKLAESTTAYKKAVNIDSTHLRSLFQLGKYYVMQRETNTALLYIDKGLEFYKNDIALINLKALALYNNNEYEKSIPFFERLIELGEEKKHIYTKLADAYFKEWEFEKAKKMYHVLITLDDENEDAYYNMGVVFNKAREIDSAKFYIQKSIEVQQVSLGKEYGFLASIYRVEEDLKTAMKYYHLAYKEDETNPLFYYQICTMVDQTNKDPKVKLEHYENFIKKFGKTGPFFSQIVSKRISELKEEIHLAAD